MTASAPRRGPSRRVRRNRTIAVTALVAALALSIGITIAVRGAAPTQPTAAHTPTTSSSSAAPFDSQALSIDDPASLWVIVNKQRPLTPDDYEPADLVDAPVPFVYQPRLRAEASDAVVAMFAAFTAQTGLKMQSQSAYRSYSAQVSTYDNWVSELGQAGADLTSARPGFSEHQTGLAIDIAALPAECSLDQCFADTAQGTWAAAHAWEYGFVIRYPEGQTAVTGYEYEPWHLRYVGAALATELHETGAATVEGFFGLPAAPEYAG